MTNEFFDSVYLGKSDYYGYEVREDFADFLRGLESRQPYCLDLGCGQGRHAVFAARAGARVHAVDYSDVAIAQLRGLAEEAGLSITAQSGDVLDLAPAPMTYDAIFMVSFLSHLAARDLARIVDMAHQSLAPGGRVYVEAFTTADPGYRKAADASETSPALRHYFAPGGLRRLFSRFAISDYREFVEDDRTHGPAHRHGVALLIAGRGR